MFFFPTYLGSPASAGTVLAASPDRTLGRRAGGGDTEVESRRDEKERIHNIRFAFTEVGCANDVL